MGMPFERSGSRCVLPRTIGYTAGVVACNERRGADLDLLNSLQMSEEDVKKQIASSQILYEKNPTDYKSSVPLIWAQYMHSMHFLQENTLENAKKLGYLDARELYPDIPKHTLEKYAQEFYSMPEPGEVYNREK